MVPDGPEIADLLQFKGGKNEVMQNGTVTLATDTRVGDPAPLLDAALGVPSWIPSGATMGRDIIRVKTAAPPISRGPDHACRG